MPATPRLTIPGRPRRSRDARAVVTGAGSGIGRAFAVELARRGGRVVCSDVDEAAAARTAARIGERATAVRCDVTQLAQVQQLAVEAERWFGAAPTLVVNNAGVGAGGSLVGETPIEDWHWTLDVNLWGPIHGCHVFVPILRAAGAGGIVNVASAASYGAAPRMGPYSVSKAGVLSLTETLAAELAGTGVAVTALCPTFVKTNILDGGRITGRSTTAAATLMAVTGMPPERVVRTCLDTHDRGGLYVLPQVDARLGWGLKRHAPRTFVRAAGLLERAGTLRDSTSKGH